MAMGANNDIWYSSLTILSIIDLLFDASGKCGGREWIVPEASLVSEDKGKSAGLYWDIMSPTT